MCSTGDQGKETTEWAKAAGMHGFETFWHRCTKVLERDSFVWPDRTGLQEKDDEDGKAECAYEDES